MEYAEAIEYAKENPDAPCAVKFIVEVGLLLRGPMRAYLTEIQFRKPHGVSLDFKESKDWLMSTFFVRLDGPALYVVALNRAMQTKIVSLNA